MRAGGFPRGPKGIGDQQGPANLKPACAEVRAGGFPRGPKGTGHRHRPWHSRPRGNPPALTCTDAGFETTGRCQRLWKWGRADFRAVPRARVIGTSLSFRSQCPVPLRPRGMPLARERQTAAFYATLANLVSSVCDACAPHSAAPSDFAPAPFSASVTTHLLCPFHPVPRFNMSDGSYRPSTPVRLTPLGLPLTDKSHSFRSMCRPTPWSSRPCVERDAGLQITITRYVYSILGRGSGLSEMTLMF